MIKKILILMVAFLMVSCSSNLKVQKYQTNQVLEEPFIAYNLPSNRIDLVFTLCKTEIIPGPFVAYSEQYLEIKPKVTKAVEKWQVSDIQHFVSGGSDVSQRYCISGNVSDIQPENLLQLSMMGQNQANLPVVKKQTEQFSHIPDFPERSLKNILIEDSKSSYKLITTDSVAKRIPVINTILRNKTEAEIAKDAARMLKRIRKRKFRLIGALNDKFPEQGDIRYMVEKLEDKEQAYLELFMGKQKVYKEYFTVSIKPDDYRSYALFSFSEKQGRNASKIAKDQIVLTLKPIGEKLSNSNSDSLVNSLLPYKIPATVVMEISKGESVLYRANIQLSQFGTTQYLPISILKDKKIEFDTTTGAIKSIK